VANAGHFGGSPLALLQLLPQFSGGVAEAVFTDDCKCNGCLFSQALACVCPAPVSYSMACTLQAESAADWHRVPAWQNN